jgi:hypothetical protein
LHTAHRLSLQSNKTFIKEKEFFRAKELFDLEEIELKAKQDKIANYLKDLDLPSNVDPDEIDNIIDDQEAEFVRMSLRDMMNALIESNYFHVGLARYVLRRATVLRTRIIMQSLLDNIEKFIPVMRDVIIYLLKTYDKKRPEQVGEVLETLIVDSDYKSIPYVQYWVLYMLSQECIFLDASKAISLAESADKQISERMTALIAKCYKIIDWVRAKKETWSNTSPWAQRAIVWASTILPKNEKEHWLKPISNYPVPSISFIAKAVKNNK